MTYPTEALARAERTVRNEGEDHYFYVDPNQFAISEWRRWRRQATGCG